MIYPQLCRHMSYIRCRTCSRSGYRQGRLQGRAGQGRACRAEQGRALEVSRVHGTHPSICGEPGVTTGRCQSTGRAGCCTRGIANVDMMKPA